MMAGRNTSKNRTKARKARQKVKQAKNPERRVYMISHPRPAAGLALLAAGLLRTTKEQDQ